MWWGLTFPNPTVVLKNGLQYINRPNLYFRNAPEILFAIVFMTRFYIYPESFIPNYLLLDDLLRKNRVHEFHLHQMTAIIKWTCPRTLDFAFKTLQCFFIR